jgi:hypothetical protein
MLLIQHAREARPEIARGQRLLQDLVGACLSGASNDRGADIAAHQRDRDRTAHATHLADQGLVRYFVGGLSAARQVNQRLVRSVPTGSENAAGAVAAANRAITEVLDDLAGWIEALRRTSEAT